MSTERQGKFVRVSEREIHYIDEGSGPPLVLVHGWGFDNSAWNAVIAGLVARYRVIAIDVRGHGRSEAGRASYGMRDLSADLFGLVTALDLPERPVLIGHSLGGMIVQQFAADHPDALQAMVIIDADLNASTGVRLVMSAGSRIGAWVMRLAALLLGSKRSLRLYQPLLNLVSYSKAWRKTNAAHLKEAGRTFQSNTVAGLVWSLRAYASRPDLTEALASVSCRALLIRGSNDVIMTQGKMTALARAIPGARLEVVAGSGHMTIAEQPEAVVGLIDAFLQEEAPATGALTLTARHAAVT